MADGSVFNAKQSKKKPRIAFTGEEFGFGYQAVNNLVELAKTDGIYDAGRSATSKLREEREIDGRTRSSKAFAFTETIRQPLRSKEQALMAVKSGSADFAVVPFYSPYAGYDFESLRAIGNLFTICGVQQVEATDQLCLAVHESQVLELAQSAHPNSSLSHLLSKNRSKWGSKSQRSDLYNNNFSENGSDTEDNGSSGGELHRGGIVIDQSMQLVLRDRMDAIFADPASLLRCKTKLDGLRTAGVEIRQIGETVEPHREFARMTRQSLNPDRMVNTYFDPVSGDAHYVSAMNGASQTRPFFGVVLPFEVADRSSEYIIIDPYLEDAEPGKTRFMVVETVPDHTLYEDAYRTTDAKTRYWNKRLKSVDQDGETSGAQGVRVMLQFRRDGASASIGDVENFLRNYGVRHAVVRIDEDSESDSPAPIVLDIEFDRSDFDYNLGSMLTKRLRGSVVNGALKKAFQRWKNRGVLVLAAMPYDQPQLPHHGKRRWWKEALGAWASDFSETMFIRISRILFYSSPLILGLIVWAIWRLMSGQ